MIKEYETETYSLRLFLSTHFEDAWKDKIFIIN